jgi:hypothetical protein
MVGTVDEICERLEQRRQRWGFNYIVIHVNGKSDVEAFAPVVARLTGT